MSVLVANKSDDTLKELFDRTEKNNQIKFGELRKLIADIKSANIQLLLKQIKTGATKDELIHFIKIFLQENKNINLSLSTITKIIRERKPNKKSEKELDIETSKVRESEIKNRTVIKENKNSFVEKIEDERKIKDNIYKEEENKTIDDKEELETNIVNTEIAHQRARSINPRETTKKTELSDELKRSIIDDKDEQGSDVKNSNINKNVVEPINKTNYTVKDGEKNFSPPHFREDYRSKIKEKNVTDIRSMQRKSGEVGEISFPWEFKGTFVYIGLNGSIKTDLVYKKGSEKSFEEAKDKVLKSKEDFIKLCNNKKANKDYFLFVKDPTKEGSYLLYEKKSDNAGKLKIKNNSKDFKADKKFTSSTVKNQKNSNHSPTRSCKS